MKTARTNLESKALQQTPKLNMFPACTATTVEDFLVWDNKILAILATPEWSSLYDTKKNDVIDDGSLFPDLNNHFYSSLLSAMKNNNAKIMQNKRHLNQDGVAFIRLCELSTNSLFPAANFVNESPPSTSPRSNQTKQSTRLRHV